ncbi:hypothetical protein ACV3NL_04055 [Clostridium perfringens]|nr:hypothetical protein [Clostridium perfringens]MDK0602569.1 hypothetical protein [Clostridium perfringens]
MRYFEIEKYKCPSCLKVFESAEMSSNKRFCKKCYREYMRVYMKKRRSKGRI